MNKKSIRNLLLYEFKCGRSPQQTADNINRTEETKVIDARTVKRWFERFKKGDLSLKDRKRPGRPVLICKDKLASLIEKTPNATCKYLASELGVSRSTIQKTLKQLGTRKNLSEWMQITHKTA